MTAESGAPDAAVFMRRRDHGAARGGVQGLDGTFRRSVVVPTRR